MENILSFSRFNENNTYQNIVYLNYLSDGELCDIWENIFDHQSELKEKWYSFYDFYNEIKIYFDEIYVTIININPCEIIKNVERQYSEHNLNRIVNLMHDTYNLPRILMNGDKFYDGYHRLKVMVDNKITSASAIDISNILNYDWLKFLNGDIDFKNHVFINESLNIENLYKSLHGAIDVKTIVKVKDLIGVSSKFPSQEQFNEVVEFLKIDGDYIFYDNTNKISPFFYWNDYVFCTLEAGFNLEGLKMFRTDKSIKNITERTLTALKEKNYEILFLLADKKILIPLFVLKYKEIPDIQKYDVFISIYTRSEFGFEMLPKALIKNCFTKRFLSDNWKERIEELKIKTKNNPDIIVYRGVGPKSVNDINSYTLDRKVALFFANRFGAAGKVIKLTVNISEVIDYIDSRGESEILLDK